MTNDVTIINQKYEHFEVEHLIKENEALELEVKRLRKDKDLLLEQMCLWKKLHDGLFDRWKLTI